MASEVLRQLLAGMSISILCKKSSKSRLEKEVTKFRSVTRLVQAAFSIELKGVKNENTTIAENLALDSLHQVAKNSFENDTI